MIAFLEGIIEMAEPQKMAFDALAFLAEADLGRRIVQLKPKQAFFSQGGPADSIFYLQRGRAKQTVVSKNGKEATIALCDRRLHWTGVSRNCGGAAPGLSHCHHRLYSTEDREGGNGPRDTRGTLLHRPICEISVGPQHASLGRSYRSALQLQRKAIGENPPPDG